jgi:hypothetical protein
LDGSKNIAVMQERVSRQFQSGVGPDIIFIQQMLHEPGYQNHNELFWITARKRTKLPDRGPLIG